MAPVHLQGFRLADRLGTLGECVSGRSLRLDESLEVVMAWKDVCVRGKPAGGKVREDDIPNGAMKEMHDAGGPSPGIEKFIREVVRTTPLSNTPPKPADFPTWVNIQSYPGRGAVDVHLEGRAADIFLSVMIPAQKASGDWLFDWCVANCMTYQIQGLIFGTRRWFSEYHGGVETVYTAGDHNNHVHVELNGDGAALSSSSPASVPAGLAGTWNVTIGTWSGIFVFGADRSVSWANDDRSRRTPGSWSSDGGRLYFQFHDPGDFRFFSAPLPLNPSGTSGTILPAGQGFFEMRKRP